MKTIYQCQYCQSDNVQVKAWVRPNNNNAYVEEAEGDELGWCEDCEQHVVVETVEVEDDAHVIGYQVVGISTGEINPHMDTSFCVYNLKQAKQMLEADNKFGIWKLLTIWDTDIENPTMMFSGDPRA